MVSRVPRDSCHWHRNAASERVLVPRFNVEFSAEINGILDDLARRQSCTKADVIRRSIALLKWYEETMRDGNRIVIERKDGTLAELLRF